MFSSIPSLQITGSGTSADGNAFSANTSIENSTVILGAVLSASYAITAAYAASGGSGGAATLQTGSFYPITASRALTASVAEQTPVLTGPDGIIYFDDLILPRNGGGYIGEYGNGLVDFYSQFGNIVKLTTDYISTNGTTLGVWQDIVMGGGSPDTSSIKKLIGTASYADNALTVDKITKISSSAGDTIQLHNSIESANGLNIALGTSANPFAETYTTNLYVGTEYVDELVANNNGYITAIDSIHGSLVGTASYASYALTSSYALNGGGGGGGTTLVTGSSYPITSSWANKAQSSLFASQSRWATSASWASSSVSSSYATVALNSINGSVSASYALTSSYALNGGSGGGGTTLTTGSFYPITASWANNLSITSSAQTTGSYFLVSNDNGKVITFTNATTNSIVVPSGLPTNFNCFFVSVSTGSVLVTGSGVQLNNANNCFKLSGRYSAASLVGYLPNAYILFGDVSL